MRDSLVKPGNDISDRREKNGKLPTRKIGESLEADYKLEEIVGSSPTMTISKPDNDIKTRATMTEGKRMIFTFKELSQILELDEKKEEIDRLCFESVYSSVLKYISFDIEEKNHNELHTVIDGRILIDQINIKRVLSIIDQNIKERIKNYVIDYKNKTITFISCRYDGHVVLINYNSGFCKKNYPPEIKKAIIDLFLTERNNYYKRLKGEECSDEEMNLIMQKYLGGYSRKSL